MEKEVTALNSTACLSAEVSRLRTFIREVATRLAAEADRCSVARCSEGDMLRVHLLMEEDILRDEVKRMLKFLSE